MEVSKSKVITKSSNSAITTKHGNKRAKTNKSESQRKKSKSNAEFQILVQKRGVKIENKHASETNADEKQVVKPPPRPRPGTKRFLTSVLTILSKATAGTQYPDSLDTKNKKEKPNKKTAEKTDASLSVESEIKKKPKFRSKILNETKNQLDKFEVLQHKKEIVQTPSLYSEKSCREDITKWSDLPRLVKPVCDEVNESAISNLVREVREGRALQNDKEKIVKVVDPDPPTLVSEHTELKDDKRLYSFFVDLLESTFSVYNVKADYDAAPMCSPTSSKLALEMNKSVARKLNVETEMFDDVTQKPSKHFHCLGGDENCWNNEILVNHFLSTACTRRDELPFKSPSQRRSMKTESFAFTRKKKIPVPQVHSVVITQRKSFYRNNQKEDLLNLLKGQLRMDHVSFEEPQNFYQALKIMARNKRKEKTISFDKSMKRTSAGHRPPECMLNCRKVLSPRKKCNSKYENEYLCSPTSIAQKNSETNRSRIENLTATEYLSTHSLEVYGFDYEVASRKRHGKEKGVYMTYHSSPSTSEHEEDLMMYSHDSCSSTIKDFESIHS